MTRDPCLRPAGFASPWTTAKHETSRRALLRRLANRNVVIKADAQIEVRAFELRRKRLEGAGSADGRGCGHVQGLFARRPINAQALTRKAAVAIDAERYRHDSLVTQIKRFRHHRDPVLFQLGKQPVDVALKIHALGGRQNRDAIARLRAASSAAAMAPSAALAAGNSAFRSVRSTAGGTVDRIPQIILHRFAGRSVRYSQIQMSRRS